MTITVKPRFNGLMRKCKCPLFEKARILRSVDAQNTFWLKSLLLPCFHVLSGPTLPLLKESMRMQIFHTV